jgi:DNA-directed RNA polymerase I subunit RPA49
MQHNMAETDKSKKRKRQSGVQEELNKKMSPTTSAPVGAFSSVKVRHIPPEEDAQGPIVGEDTCALQVGQKDTDMCIASTPGISAPEDIVFTPYKRTITSRSNEKSKRQQVLLQSSQHGRLDYIAQEEQAGGPLGNLKHYVGIYDPQVGEFTITECHKVTLRSTLRPTQEELDEEARQRDRQTYASMRMSLGQEFGTKKAKKVIADATVNAINQRKPGETAPPVDAAQQAMIDSLHIKSEGMMTAEERQLEADNSKPRPTPNMAATSPAEAYPLENLISDDELSVMRVNEWQASVKTGENIKLTMRYVARRVRKVATSNDTKNLQILKYVDTMLTWFVALDSNRGNGKKLPPRDKLKDKVSAPGAIFQSLRKKFTDGQYVQANPFAHASSS